MRMGNWLMTAGRLLLGLALSGFFVLAGVSDAGKIGTSTLVILASALAGTAALSMLLSHMARRERAAAERRARRSAGTSMLQKETLGSF